MADGDKLSIKKTPNAVTPTVEGLNPLLTLDVWEHAYYLDFQNRRSASGSVAGTGTFGGTGAGGVQLRLAHTLGSAALAVVMPVLLAAPTLENNPILFSLSPLCRPDFIKNFWGIVNWDKVGVQGMDPCREACDARGWVLVAACPAKCSAPEQLRPHTDPAPCTGR